MSQLVPGWKSSVGTPMRNQNGGTTMGTPNTLTPLNSLSTPMAAATSATPYTARRAGDMRIVNAMKKACVHFSARVYQGSARKALLSTPRVKKR